MRASLDARIYSQEAIQLEREFATKPEEALSDNAASSVGATDQTEITICHTAIGVTEIRMVKDIKCFSPDLHLQLLPNWHSAEKAEIKISVSGSANRAEPRRAKPRLAYWSKGGCIEIRRNRPMCSVDRHFRLDLICYLRIPWRIQRIAGSRDGERGSRVTGEDPIGLPPPGDRGSDAAGSIF